MSRTLRRYLSREAKGTEATFHRDSSSAPPPHHPVSFYTLYRSNRETLLAVYIGWRSSICAGWRSALQGAEHLAANRRGRIRRRLIPCCSSAARCNRRRRIHQIKHEGQLRVARFIAWRKEDSKEFKQQRTPEVGVSRGCSRNCVVAWRDRALPPHFKSVTLYSPIECGQGRNSSALFCDFRTNCPVVSALL